jgi:translation initiation factor IF-2
MSEVKKPVRLSKVAKEFNIGIATIVDFLNDKGIEVDSNPNTKLDHEKYALIRDEFADEKELKEKSKSVSRTRTERETITLDSAKKEKEKPQEEEEEIDLSKFKTSEIPPGVSPSKKEEVEEVEAKASDEAEAPAEEAAPEAEEKEAPPAAEEAPAAPAEEKKEEKEEKAEETAEEAPAEEEAPKRGPKVVGKMNLDNVEIGRGKRSKKAKEAKAEDKAEAKKEAPAPEKTEEKSEKPAAKAEDKAEAPKEAPKEAEEKKEEKKEPEIMKGKAEKLSGPKVVGKIELKEEPRKKKPVASSSDSDARKKRKRKRISKVDVDSQSRGDNRRGGKKKGDQKQEISDKDIQKEIKETLARLSGGKKSKSSKLRRAKRDAVAAKAEEEQQRLEEESTVLKLTEFVTVSELASMMSVQVNDVISACMTLGIMASINQRLDAETIQIIAEEFGYQIEFVSADVQEAIQEEEDAPETLEDRPPIVTVMGHVDHGKTSLLDYVRKANVIAGEAGGITQHIGAYNVQLDGGKTITFLDTPGHEAFTAMRARGAQVTDLAIIVIAADDSVMPQTIEAINHAQAADIPMVFAFNKIDKPGANPDKIREELSKMNILVEDWGGKFQAQEISAKKGEGIEDLLEKVLLEAELLELKANPKKRAVGTVVESSLDKGRGYVSTLLVEGGTLRVGDSVLAGQYSGRVKAMYNERGQRIEEAGPSMPVSMLGLSGAAAAGDKFHVLEDEKEARNIAIKRQQLQREQGVRTQRHITIEEIGRRIALGEFKELNLIVKGDVDGSIEALSDSLQKLSTEKIQVNIIHKAVGQISESDVLLASASDAIIIGFQVRPSASARKLAETEEIQIRLYSVIYKAIEEMKEAMEGMLSAKIEEKVVGTAEIRETFKISKVGTIAGCYVLDGKINRNHKVRVIRDGIVIYTGELGSLKRFKDDVKEVSKGYECGLNVERFNDIKVGDNIEAFEEVEVKQTLDS